MTPRIRGAVPAAALLALAACAETSPSITAEQRARLSQLLASPASGSFNPPPNAMQEPRAEKALPARREAAAEAADAYRALMAQEGRSEARLLQIGRLLLRADDAAGAAQAYGEALSLNGQSLAAITGLGLSQEMMGDRATAQATFRRGLALAPGDWTLRSNLAFSLLGIGAAREAAGVLAQAETLPDAPASARHNLALALVADGQPDRALRVLRTDMGPAEARALAEDLERFSRTLLATGGAQPAPVLPRAAERPGPAPLPVAGAPSAALLTTLAHPSPPILADGSSPALRAAPGEAGGAQASEPLPSLWDSVARSFLRKPGGVADAAGPGDLLLPLDPPGFQPYQPVVARGALLGSAGRGSADATGRLTAGEAALANGELDMAEELLRSGRETGGDVVGVALLEARIARARGDLGRARRALEEAARLRQEQLRGS